MHAAFPGTPQIAWPLLAQRAGTEVWVKHENHTFTGAFKVRGGLVYADCLRRNGLGFPVLSRPPGAITGSRSPLPGGAPACL